MNERLDIKTELKRKFAKITLDYCGHLLENHINKTDEQLQRRLKDNRNLRVASSFYGEKSQIMQTIKEDLLSEDSLDQLTDYFLDQEWKDPYFLYFQIPEGIKAAAYKFDHKHNWKKGALVCEEYIVVIKKKPDYLFSGNWGIASIYPFPTGLIWF